MSGRTRNSQRLVALAYAESVAWLAPEARRLREMTWAHCQGRCDRRLFIAERKQVGDIRSALDADGRRSLALGASIFASDYLDKAAQLGVIDLAYTAATGMGIGYDFDNELNNVPLTTPIDDLPLNEYAILAQWDGIVKMARNLWRPCVPEEDCAHPECEGAVVWHDWKGEPRCSAHAWGGYVEVWEREPLTVDRPPFDITRYVRNVLGGTRVSSIGNILYGYEVSVER